MLSPEHAFPPRIQEFRNLEKSTGTIRRRIRRPRADTLPGRSPETLQSGGNQTQGQLSSDPINLDSPERPRAEEQRSQTQTVGSPAADEVSLVKVQWTHDRPLKYGRRRESGNAQSPKTYRTDLFRPKENMDGDSIDELQEDQVLPRSHRQTISSKRNVPRRGSTLDESALASAKATIGSGLRVAEATTYANGYSEAEDGTERYLQLGDRHDCLVPVNHKGVPVEELEWMKISLDSCARIFRAKSDCSVIEILRRTSGDVRPEDKTLMVSFSSVDSVRRFDEWASRESKNMDLKDK